MSNVISACTTFFLYAVIAIFAQNAVLARGMGVSRVVQLVGDNDTSSLLFGLELSVICMLDAPLAWLQVTFPAHAGAAGAEGMPVLPTQLFEAGALFLFFVVLYRLHRRCAQARPGLVAGVYLLGSAVIRFAVEFLRDDPRSMFGALSIGQVTSVALALCALPFLLRRGGGAQGNRSS